MAQTKRRKKEFSEIEAKKRIRKLTVQNNRMQREIDSLKQEINELKGKGISNRRADKYRAALQKCSGYKDMYSKKSYFGFIWTHLKHTSFFQTYSKIISYIRRYTFITTSLKIISLLFVFVEAAVFIVISTSAFIASLVFTLLVSHLLMIFTFFSRKKHTKKNTALLSGKNVIILFPPKQRAFESDSFFCGFARELAKSENTRVVIVSPFLLNSLGTDGRKKAYYLDRAAGENILMVRRNYYFTLKKKIIDPLSASITEIY